MARFSGELLTAGDAGISIRPAGDSSPRHFTYEQIQRARTVLVWGPTPKPGSAGRGRRDAASRARAATSSAPMKDPAP